MKPNFYLLFIAAWVCFFPAKATYNDSLNKTGWEKVAGWHAAISYTRNTLNHFSVDFGRYKTYKHNGEGPRCAFSTPPFVSRGIGLYYIYKQNTASGFAFRLFAQMEMLGVAGMRVDLINSIENGRYSTKIRPGMGISLAYFLDLQLNYTFGLFNEEDIPQGAGVTLRFNFNPWLNKKLYSGPNLNIYQ